MIRFIACLRKREDVSDVEFRQFWQSAETQQLLTNIQDTFAADRCSFSLGLKVEAHIELKNRLGGEVEPYDGVVECIWTSTAQLADMYEGKKAQAFIDSFEETIHQVADRQGSIGFFTEYNAS